MYRLVDFSKYGIYNSLFRKAVDSQNGGSNQRKANPTQDSKTKCMQTFMTQAGIENSVSKHYRRKARCFISTFKYTRNSSFSFLGVTFLFEPWSLLVTIWRSYLRLLIQLNAVASNKMGWWPLMVSRQRSTCRITHENRQ